MPVSPEQQISLTLDAAPPDGAAVARCIEQHLEDCAAAASVWSRLHYEHAALTEGSLRVGEIRFRTETEGTAAIGFDWTRQDGCSDIHQSGQGYVEFDFRISGRQLQLNWAFPEPPSTADEL